MIRAPLTHLSHAWRHRPVRRRELEDDVGSTTMLMPLKRVTPEHSETNVRYVGAVRTVSALYLAAGYEFTAVIHRSQKQRRHF